MFKLAELVDSPLPAAGLLPTGRKLLVLGILTASNGEKLLVLGPVGRGLSTGWLCSSIIVRRSSFITHSSLIVVQE